MKNLEHAIEQAVKDWPAVGLCCAAVMGGEPAFTRGFGVKRIGTQEPVDEHTLFAIGSVSKSFTGAAVAMLVDEGALAWESRVIDHLPSFRLFDPYVTREMTVRDLLTHRSGLERGDLMWYKSGYDSREVLRRVAFLEPAWSFRTAFGYQNVMYLAAGALIEALSGKSWDDFIEERIFKPLRMNESRPSLATVDLHGNVAQPHAKVDGTLVAIPAHDSFNTNPAGSIYSNAVDMLAWLRLALDGGVFQDQRLLTTSSSETTQTLHMPIARSGWSEAFPEADSLGYGAGWFVWSYRGRKIVSHGGNIDGMTAMAGIVPEEGFGISVLANVDGSRLPQAILYSAIDEVLGSSRRSWLVDFRAMERAAEERLQFASDERARLRIADTRPSRPLEAYAGVYADEFYGSATVTYEDDALRVSFIGFDGKLEHWQLDTFALALEDQILKKYDPIVRFGLDDFGEPSEMTLIFLGVIRATLQRKPVAPNPVEITEEERRSVEGTFVSIAPPLRIVIERLNDALKATVPGSLAGVPDDTAPIKLTPMGEGRFALRTAQHVLRFEEADSGAETLWLEIPHQMPVRLTRNR